MPNGQTEVHSQRRGSRCVAKILERRRAEKKKRRQVLAPDFVHGEVEVASIYGELGSKWVQRALFVVDDGQVSTVAYFDDYFLVVQQWHSDDGMSWDRWFEQFLSPKRRVIAIDFGDHCRLPDDICMTVDVDRRRFTELERGLLGIAREGSVELDRAEGKLRNGEVDVLSLVTLMTALLRQ